MAGSMNDPWALDFELDEAIECVMLSQLINIIKKLGSEHEVVEEQVQRMNGSATKAELKGFVVNICRDPVGKAITEKILREAGQAKKRLLRVKLQKQEELNRKSGFELGENQRKRKASDIDSVSSSHGKRRNLGTQPSSSSQESDDEFDFIEKDNTTPQSSPPGVTEPKLSLETIRRAEKASRRIPTYKTQVHGKSKLGSVLDRDAERRVAAEQAREQLRKQDEAIFLTKSDIGVAECARCNKNFDQGDNEGKSCLSHSGVVKEYSVGVTTYNSWSCWKSSDSEGCKNSKHVSTKIPGIVAKIAAERRKVTNAPIAPITPVASALPRSQSALCDLCMGSFIDHHSNFRTVNGPHMPVCGEYRKQFGSNWRKARAECSFCGEDCMISNEANRPTARCVDCSAID